MTSREQHAVQQMRRAHSEARADLVELLVSLHPVTRKALVIEFADEQLHDGEHQQEREQLHEHEDEHEQLHEQDEVSS